MSLSDPRCFVCDRRASDLAKRAGSGGYKRKQSLTSVNRQNFALEVTDPSKLAILATLAPTSTLDLCPTHYTANSRAVKGKLGDVVRAHASAVAAAAVAKTRAAAAAAGAALASLEQAARGALERVRPRPTAAQQQADAARRELRQLYLDQQDSAQQQPTSQPPGRAAAGGGAGRAGAGAAAAGTVAPAPVPAAAAVAAAAELKQLANETLELVCEAQTVLASIFQGQRVAATKLLSFRLVNLLNHTSLCVARVTCGALSSADMRSLAQHVTQCVQRRLGSGGAVIVQAYDGESTAMRLGENAAEPTTAKQVADSILGEFRSGKDSFFAKLIKRRGGQVSAAREELALEALRLLPAVAAEPAAAAGVSVEEPPALTQPGRRGASLRGGAPSSEYESMRSYLAGELRPGQLAYLQQQVERRMQQAGLPTNVKPAWLSLPDTPLAEAPVQQAALPTAPLPPPRPPRARRASARMEAPPAAVRQVQAGAGRGHRRTASVGESGAYGSSDDSGGGGASGGGGPIGGGGSGGGAHLGPTEQLLQSWLPEDWEAWATFARAELFGGEDVSPTQMLAAFRLVHASQCSDLKPKQLADLLAQVAYDAQRTSLAASGRDLVNSYYQAAVSPLTGQLLFDHEDYVHKTKNFVSQLRNQPADPGPVLVKRTDLVTVAGQFPALAHVVGTLAKNTDSQNVPICEALLYDEELQVRLAEAGHVDQALVLRVLGHAHQAWDMPHLADSVRAQRQQNLHSLLFMLLGPQLANVDTAAKAASRSHKLLGMTAELCSVMCGNVESRQQLLRLLTPDEQGRFVDRGQSTDDLECEFSCIVNGCGYKPPADMAMGYLANSVEFLTYARRCQRELGVALAKSSKAHYSYHEETRRGDSSWNDGLFMTEAGVDAADRYVARVVDRARNALGQKRDRTIRSYHQHAFRF